MALKPKHETVDVPELGGKCVVQQLMLDHKLELGAQNGYARIAFVLDKCVRNESGMPVAVEFGENGEVKQGEPWTQEDWRIFGGNNFESALHLFDAAMRLSGMGGGDEKNGEAQSGSSPAT
jgi:hypothetical protein